MTINLPGFPVDAPVVGPAKHDLVRSAQKGDAARFEDGVRFFPEGSATMSLAEYAQGSSPATKSSPKTAPTEVVAPPWIIEAAWTRPVGVEIKAFGERAMEQTESSLIELKLAEGAGSTGAPYLSDANCTTLGTTAVSPIKGVGRIQQAFALIGGHGTIYVNPLIAASLAAGDFFEEIDGKLYDVARGDLIIVGNVGAKGKGPTTAAADASYIFGHLGEPILYLSEAQVYGDGMTEGIEYTTNTGIVRVEKTVVVEFNTGQWETLVTPA